MQVVEFFQREVEQLEEKLAELGDRARKGRAGARTLEAVRKEAEDASRISLGATCRHGKFGQPSKGHNCQKGF